METPCYECADTGKAAKRNDSKKQGKWCTHSVSAVNYTIIQNNVCSMNRWNYILSQISLLQQD